MNILNREEYIANMVAREDVNYKILTIEDLRAKMIASDDLTTNNIGYVNTQTYQDKDLVVKLIKDTITTAIFSETFTYFLIEVGNKRICSERAKKEVEIDYFYTDYVAALHVFNDEKYY